MEDAGQILTGGLDSGQNVMSKAAVCKTAEGVILLIGIGLALLFTVWVLIGSPPSGEKGRVLAGMAVTKVMFGRAATIQLGYEFDLSDRMVIFTSIILETIHVLIFYPLFVFSWRHLLTFKWLDKSFGRVHRAAEANKGKIQRYGIIGLFVFVCFPLWMTGPTVGCVIGYMLGLRAWVNMTVVLSGTYVAILGWAFLLKRFHEQAKSYGSYAGLVVIIVAVIIIATVHRIREWRSEKKSKA
jgi:uncharacterized membrane protein